jgi:hypothetical protein
MVFWIGNIGIWDASATDGLNCMGYSGIGSDGEYLYYSPLYNGSAYHGVILRQKIYAVFKDENTWEAYDAGSVDGLTTKGFFGNPIFDGQFMYFVPNNNGSVSGIVLRYDTTKPFKSATSWQAYDAGSVDSLTTKGFRGAVFDGHFIYFVPFNNGAYNGIVLRYDTKQPFKSSDSWAAYDLGAMADGAAKGYWGAVLQDNFIYFSPCRNATAYHGQILRYDLTQPFKSAGAWTVFNAATVSVNCKGLGAPCTDGRFIYYPNATYNLVLRYDSTLPFTDAGSYSTYDSTLLSENTDDQHNCCCIQGKYITFAPSYFTILIYDTEKPFADSGSWAERDVFYAEDMLTCGFLGAYSDPNYIYFAPSAWGTEYHGTVLRVRVNPCPAQALPTPSESEDLTEYMYYNPNEVSVTTHRATAIGIDASCSAYVWQDYEKDCFDGFEIWFDVKLSSLTAIYTSPQPAPTYLGLWSLSNKHSELLTGLGTNDPSAMFVIKWNTDGSVASRKLHLAKNMSLSAGYSISLGTVYYCKVTRSAGSATITLQIYAEAARTTLLSTQTITTFSTSVKWRFIYALRGILDDEALAMATFYLENLQVVSYS